MADPLTVVGIIANIIQLVEFSAKVLKRLDDYQSSVGDVPKVFQNIKAELPVLQVALRKTRDKIDDGAIEEATKAALLPAVDGCKNQVEALDRLIAVILPSDGDSHLKKTKKALWSVTQDSKVENIMKTLRGYITTLTFYHAAASSTLIPMKDEKLVKIRRWLSPPDPSVNYQKAIGLRQHDTGLWFLESDIYSKWKVDTASSVWLYGIPGCGKSILCSTVIQDILLCCTIDPGEVVAYFFFDFTDSEKQKPELMVRSLISQLSEQCIKMPLALEALYSSSDKGNREPSLDALMIVLQQMLQEFPQSYLILDALDECADRVELVNIIEQIAGWKLEKMHILVTSRNERDIKDSLEGFVKRENIVCLQRNVEDKDIQAYVRQRLSDDKKLKKWQDDAVMRQLIETTLMEGSCGMFRWAVCQMDALRMCRTRAALQKNLKSLPATLDETYERILCSISNEDLEYGLCILRWLCYSARPLSVKELAEVVAIDVEREPAFDSDEVLEDPSDVLDICMSLVSVVIPEVTTGSSISNRASRSLTTTSPIVTLAHYSVQEYLVSDRICKGRAKHFSMQPASCHAYIARGCIGYLFKFEEVSLDHFDDPTYLRNVHTLAQYAAEYWMSHARNATQDDEQLVNLATRFLSTKGGAYLNSLRLCNLDERYRLFYLTREEVYVDPSPIYYASLGRLSDVMSRLITEGADVNARGGIYDNALGIAAYKGYDEIVELLLRNGAKIHAGGGLRASALGKASLSGQINIVEKLLNRGANVNTNNNEALRWASTYGHYEVVKLLLSKGANVNANNNEALREASLFGYYEVVELLLSKGADINANDNEALREASFFGYYEVVELLLNKGADVNANNNEVLRRASSKGYYDIVKLLLSKGADIHADNNEAFRLASSNGHDKVVELLMSKGKQAPDAHAS